MAKKATKAVDNVFYKARMDAAECNDKLASREGAAETMGMDRTRLARIELDTILPYPEEILMMADEYNAPQLCNHFCANMCPLGKDLPTEINSIATVTVKIHKALNINTIENTKQKLLDIADDGLISDHEKPQLEEIIKFFNDIIKASEELILLGEKCLKNE